MEEDRGGGGGLHKPQQLHVYLLVDHCGKSAENDQKSGNHDMTTLIKAATGT